MTFPFGFPQDPWFFGPPFFENGYPFPFPGTGFPMQFQSYDPYYGFNQFEFSIRANPFTNRYGHSFINSYQNFFNPFYSYHPFSIPPYSNSSFLMPSNFY